ncbi:S53 family peptidase [Cellulomonas sp. PhB143]|uniref:S53 family peptidase n=1 Tax=Cellulomonas sp. PhB143 TaxID=2485186 RepID=UPI000F470BD9|nr:S53 family peptidase [Cellulomonas sp. PhB143]ROS79145.1 FG-GAP repeat protein [Cellulomonas sp. PhB143]
MRPRPRSLRSAGVVATAATLAALLSAPVATAAPGGDGDPDGDSPDAVSLTHEQLDALGEKFLPRTDGTPGLVADAAGAGSGSNGTGSADGTPETRSGTLGASAGATDGQGSGLVGTSAWETVRGTVTPLALDGTRDWVGISSGGTVARYDKDGDPVWQRTSRSLVTDWDATPTNAYQGEAWLPVMYQGYNPYQPSSVGRHPFAQDDFNGDGVNDLAVAYDFGNSPPRPFTTPGSDLQSGTFVTVVDGASGSTLWHTLLPGTVGSMHAQDGTLVVADSTGPSWNVNPVAEQGDSRSSLVAYRFTTTGKAKHGAAQAVKGHEAWRYSTNAPFARFSDVESAGDHQVVVGWTDTPIGLGDDRPAAGHVVVLDARDGDVAVDTKVPGYPRIVQADPVAHRVLVAEQNDPTAAVRWDLTAVDARSGERNVITTRDSTIPVALAVNTDAHGNQPRYAVGEIGINADLTDGASTVSAWDASGRTLWSHAATSSVGADESPVLDVAIDTTGRGTVVAAVADPVASTNARPEGPTHSRILAFDAPGGSPAWSNEGSVVGASLTSYQGQLLTVGYGLTAWRTDISTGRSTALPLLGDAYGAAATDVNGDGVADLVVGGQSQGVFALDGRSLGKTVPDVLWRTAVSAPVHEVQVAPVEDRKGHATTRVVVATSHGFAVLDPRRGTIVSDVDTGAFQPGVLVTDGSVVASTDAALTSFTAEGRTRWSYRPAKSQGKDLAFSVAATDGKGHVFAEVGGMRPVISAGTSDPAPAAVSLNALTGAELWSQRPADPTAAWIQRKGVYASPDVPGADGRGVVFAWGGDKPATRLHLVQVVDGGSGEVLRTDRSPGSATFYGYTSSPTHGLVEVHTAQLTVYPADGAPSYRVPTISEVESASFARTTGGDETFVGAAGGMVQYDQPFPDEITNHQSADSQLFSLFAGAVHPVDLGRQGATDLVGVAFDNTAFNLDQQVGGYAANSSAIDNWPHGVTVQHVDQAATPSGEVAPGTAGTASSASPVEDTGLPTGLASAPHEIQRSTPVSPAAADDQEVTTGYTPQQIQARLGLTGDGTGQTVAVSIAYHYATARDDLNHFAKHFDLPQTCDTVAEGTDCFDFEQVSADAEQPAVDASWNQEAALDIEWVHSVAPHAKIVLVEAADASSSALYRAVDVAATYEPAAINNSWGMREFSEEAYYDGHCEVSSVCVQSTGDAGYPAGYSSTNPWSLAIGGTHLELDDAGATLAESAWASTGGGLSYFEKRPAYQKGVQPSRLRATPDVSFVADPRTGVAVYVTVQGRAYWMEVGGTSLSAPVWSGILAATDQLRADAGSAPLAVDGRGGDTAHAAVYGLGDALFDVTEGANGLCGTECTAGPGFDTVTGLGSPVAGIDAALAAK